MTDISELAENVRAGERRALARAITLVESTRPDHREEAEVLLADLAGDAGESVRVGISGTPGVGKSTFIEASGVHLCEAGHRVGVLAVDPSSVRGGGSILGDKTRMERLGREPHAFIRPTPSSGQLGGVARHTRESILLCEAAGFDVVIVETVGVGQSETAAADMVDMFMLLLAPGGGDELQGIKRGIMELADLVVVNKADGDLLQAAQRAATEYQSALNFMRPRYEAWSSEVLTTSALDGVGIAEVWEAVARFKKATVESGEFAGHRARQARAWIWDEIKSELVDTLRRDSELASALERLEDDVVTGKAIPAAAAREVLGEFRERGSLRDC